MAILPVLRPGLSALDAAQSVIERFAAFRECARCERNHHERWDGVGYPDRISGDEFPLGARILAVADSFDAMTSGRPYREGMPVERAVAILQSDAGAQWDPDVVEAFVTIVTGRPGNVPVFRPSTVTPAGRSHSSGTETRASDPEAA